MWAGRNIISRKQCKNIAYWFLKHGDASLEVQTEVHHLPLDPLADIGLLLHHEHVVVEELLEFLNRRW